MILSNFKLQHKYSLVHATYGILNAILLSFTAVFLKFFDYTDYQIGVTVAFIALASIAIQLITSDLVDGKSIDTLKTVMIILYGVVALSCLLLMVLPNNKRFTFLFLFGLAQACHGSNSGFINALYTKYLNLGLSIDFGKSRSFASLTYSISVLVIGFLLDYKTPNILLQGYLLLSVLGLYSINNMPSSSKTRKPITIEKKESMFKLLSNDIVLLFLITLIIASAGQSIGSTFLINTINNVGGNVRNLGITLLIQAAFEIPIMWYSFIILKRFNHDRLLIFSFFSASVRMLLLTFATNIWIVYLVGFMNMFSFGIFSFASVLFGNSIVKANEEVRIQSLIALCYFGGIGAVVGNFFSGYIIKLYDFKVAMIVSSLLVITAFFLMILLSNIYRTKKEQQLI